MQLKAVMLPRLRNGCSALRQQKASTQHVHRSILRRTMCTVDEDKYLEIKQLRDIKSEEFYDEQAEKRRYFYYIDLQGRLFLENTRPKNIATSLKSSKFLRFFFSQLRPNDRILPNDDPELVDFLEYPYRSPCGKEMNFIKCADRPIVFEDLKQDTNDTVMRWYFVYGGGELTMPFDPAALGISLSTGRLYHTVDTKHFPANQNGSIGLIRSQLAVEISKHIHFRDDQEGTEIIGDIEWQGQLYLIKAIE